MPEESPIVFDFPETAAPQVPELAAELAVLPLINTVLFPHMLTPLYVARAQAVAAVEDAMRADRVVLAIAQRHPEVETLVAGDLYGVGVEAVIQRLLKLPDGSISVVVQGRRRARVLHDVEHESGLRVQVEPIAEAVGDEDALEGLMRAVLAMFEQVVRLSRTISEDAYVAALNVTEPGWLADLIAAHLPLDVARRQDLLEQSEPAERLTMLTHLLGRELEMLQIEHQIHRQVQGEMDKAQREMYLREQMRAIQGELGQSDPHQRDLKHLRERFDAADLPGHAHARVAEELERLEYIPSAAPEYSVVRTYLDWLASLPWRRHTSDSNDLLRAARVLDEHHDGLRPTKDRVLEFLAARILAGPQIAAPILCFVGPPGVGKTSLGKAIATALGREFVRVSLGGVRDEAEIRGHRRTYIGALPGRIIKGMKEAGSANPVFVLDEIDKLGSDFRGDPAAALLEVLDPEQNHTFADHYLDIPFDLSQVLFITTANMLDPIAPALRDRMEIIALPGYTEEEKLRIARRFLVPRQIAANGIAEHAPRFPDATLTAIVRQYTHESGVRNLEREIGAVCRSLARLIVEGRDAPQQITPRYIDSVLGVPRYSHGLAEQADAVGVASGLTWTPMGGDVISIEVSVTRGRGQLHLTGQLGNVMKESAQTALTYARANAEALGIKAKRIDRSDIHVHVPEGGVPKDGPSAGIALAVALISALSGRAVRHQVAMTGEVTLRGRVLPVGGVREKVLGAQRAGIETVVLPAGNQRDYAELPAKVRRTLTSHFVSEMSEVLAIALAPRHDEGDDDVQED